ncbi:hypothetical protein D1007_50473 [Hordeum vulgare]|nr:hypothetical protein D1007_50473 [Hordeum vulgare]
MDEFRLSFKTYAVRHQFDAKIVWTDRKKFYAKCRGFDGSGRRACKWYISARLQPDGSTVRVNQIPNKHTCLTSSQKKSSMTSQIWVAEKITPILAKTPNTAAKRLQVDLEKLYPIKLHYTTVWKAKQRAMKNLYGDWANTFRLLFNFKAEVEKRSPSSVVEIDTKSETEASWTWFMMQLKRCLGPVSPLAIYTDACKGLENAVKNVFPHAEQRECFGHLWMNLIKKFRGDEVERMWPAARSYTKQTHSYHLSKVMATCEEFGTWLNTYHSLLWYRSGFNTAIKCDHINNNLVESFNNKVKQLKDFPVHDMVDQIMIMLMRLWELRKKIADCLQGDKLPAVVQQVVNRSRGLTHLRKLPSQPIVVEQCWPTKRARVSGSRRQTSQWMEQFGAASDEIEAVHTVETEAVHTVETEVVHTVETETEAVHTVETEVVHTVENETEAVHTVETVETEADIEFHEAIASSPVKKTKMISELVCGVQPKTRNAKAKKGTRRGRKR